MTKLKILNVADFRSAQKKSRETVSNTTKVVRAHTRVISYDDKIEKLEKTIGQKVNGILNAFNALNKAVVKRIGKTELTAVQIITKDVMDDIIMPYKSYLSSMGGAKSIEEAVSYLNDKRRKEIETYGKTDNLIVKINRYYDLQIEKYLFPLRTVETQIRSMNKELGLSRAKFISIENRINKTKELAAPIESTPVVEKEIGSEKVEQTEQTIG